MLSEPCELPSARSDIDETVFTMRSLGFNEERILDYVSWIALHDYQMEFRRTHHISISTFLRKYCNISADVVYHKQTICASGRNMNPSSSDDSIGKRVRLALLNFKNKFESLTDEERKTYLADRDSISSCLIVDLQDWCLDNAETLMDLGISKCWLRSDDVLAIHCYHLNNVFEIRETLLDAICETDFLLGSRLKSIITCKSQLSIHLELCGVFEPSHTSEVIDAAVVAMASSGSNKSLCDMLPLKQHMITM